MGGPGQRRDLCGCRALPRAATACPRRPVVDAAVDCQASLYKGARCMCAARARGIRDTGGGASFGTTAALNDLQQTWSARTAHRPADAYGQNLMLRSVPDRMTTAARRPAGRISIQAAIQKLASRLCPNQAHFRTDSRSVQKAAPVGCRPPAPKPGASSLI